MSTVNLTESNFTETVQKEGITFIDWWAPWCGPCRSFGPIYEKVAAANPDVTFGKINTEEEQGLAGAFGIRSIPTLMIFRDGILLFSEPGMVPAEGLNDLLRQTKALDMDDVRRKTEAAKAQTQAA
ncbi:MAG: thioredoxin family protein [Myxococcota bacterium]